ncbi:MAG: sensor histidine kinase, partial [Bacteroidia bacterium]
PIANIALALDTIENPDILMENGKLPNYLNIIRDENQRLSENVTKILEISQLEEGKVSFQKEPIFIREIVDEVCNKFGLQVESKGGQLKILYESEAAGMRGDKIHLSNMFYNLIENALNYSQKAPVITVHIAQIGGMTEIVIADNGIGISQDELENIFTPFYRITNGNVHDVKGFGLGLSYVNRVIHMHAGEIRVKSEPGKGSTFILLLPGSVTEKQNVNVTKHAF